VQKNLASARGWKAEFIASEAHGVQATPAHVDRRMACTLLGQEVHMSLTTILIIVLIIALLGGGGYYWRR
jgi:hypothetical protein